MRQGSSNFKSSASAFRGSIKPASKKLAGDLRAGKVSFMTMSKSSQAEDADSKKEVSKSSDAEFNQDREQKFADRLTAESDRVAFSRALRGIGNSSKGAQIAPVASSSSGIPNYKASNFWKSSGAVSSGLGNDSLGEGNRWERGQNGYIGGTANLDESDRSQLTTDNPANGNFSVINSTVSSKVSWMNNGGNALTQDIRDQVVNKGKSIGEVFNQIHGKDLHLARGQTVNINGDMLPEDFGKEGNKASHAVFLADLRHGQHGGMFKSDFENFKAVALASGVKEENIHLADNWADYKAKIIEVSKDADRIKDAEGDNAQLGLLTGTAAHGYSYGGRGEHDPNAISGFSVRGQDIKEGMIEDLVGMADAHFNHTLMMNCPCHSGGFDGKTDLVAQGRLKGEGSENKELDQKKKDAIA